MRVIWLASLFVCTIAEYQYYTWPSYTPYYRYYAPPQPSLSYAPQYAPPTHVIPFLPQGPSPVYQVLTAPPPQPTAYVASPPQNPTVPQGPPMFTVSSPTVLPYSPFQASPYFIDHAAAMPTKKTSKS